MKISIVTPVFNGAHIISDAINSVISQSCQDWEWIIVNDGSSDGTGARLDRLDDPRIHVVHQANAGVSAARNAGLDRARGDYVTFLDADDTLPPEALAIRAALLDRQRDIDIVHGGVQITSGDMVLRVYRPDLDKGPLLARLARLEEGVFFNPNYMVRREKIGNRRFPKGISHCEDLIFFLSLAHDTDLYYAAVPDVVYAYRIQPKSAMSNLDGIERGYLELVRRTKSMSKVDTALRAAQMRRVRRILFRSWLRRLRPDRAMSAIFKLRRAMRGGV